MHLLKVWGDFACFARPEMKVERFSYPAPTPSAARGIFDAIYFKPKEFRWNIRRIEILKAPKFIALRRNEVKEKVSVSAVQKWMSGKAQPHPILADGDKAMLGDDQHGRTQRQTMALRDVRYRIAAEIKPWPGFEASLPALNAQFVRRASQGKCFYQPCFGCREFPAFFELVGAADAEAPAQITEDLGYMLYDVFDLSRPGACDSAPMISVFHAEVRGGVLDVPDFASSAVRRAG